MTKTQAWKLWIRAALVRMVRVAAAAAVATIGAAAIVAEVEWDVVVGVALLAAIIEGLVCLASLPEAPPPVDLWGSDEEPDTFEDLKDEGEPPL